MNRLALSTNHRLLPILICLLIIAGGCVLLNVHTEASAGGHVPQDLPTLRGDAAVNHLKQNGQYGSLLDAVQAAKKKDGRTGVESPTTDAFGLRAKLTASDAQNSHYFGDSVAISGSTAIVGAPLHDLRQGAAYVFVRSGNTWIEQQKLTASDGDTRADFGLRVAIDGERVIVGAPGANIGTAHDQGAAYIFVRSGTVWNEETKLTGADSIAGDEFGQSVAISGVTAVVGSFRGAAGNEGSEYVFVKGAIWTQQQKLVANDGANGDDFGETGLAIDGETIIVGARWANIGGNQLQGAAYIFTRSGSTWTQQQKVTAPDGAAFEEFGRSVAISGETAIVGAWKDNDGITIPGSAWIFARSGIFWTPQQKLVASDGGDRTHFGVAVAIDGETAIVGANFDGPILNQGSAYIFVRDGTTWTEQQKLSALDAAAHDRFGLGVAMSGETVIVGAVFNGLGGSAYVYGTRSSTLVAPPEKIAFSSNRDGNDEIYVMNPDGSDQMRLTNDAGSDLHPSFPADESLIAFSSTRDGNAEIYVMNGDDGSNPTRLTTNAASDTQPSFSRDGLHIVFTSNRDGNDEVYIMDADGNHQTRLTNNNLSDTDPSFSPAGTRVLFENVGADSNRDIYIMNVNGTNPTRLTTAAGDDLSAGFSRDGTRIAFASARNGNNEIYVMNPDGTSQTRLTNNSFSDIEPSFSPDSTQIAFESDRDGNLEIYTMNANGTNQSRLTNNSSIDAAPDWGGFPSPSTAGRISAGDGEAGDLLGNSVAISGDTAIVGAYGDDFGANSSQGSAYIFVRTGGAWIEQQKLVAADGADSDSFGWTVAISGETAIVGARYDDLATGFDQGSAYIFVRNGTTWTQQQKLTATDVANNDNFGWSVAINGETAIVGALSNIGTNNRQGSAYVFVRNGTTWTQQQKLTAAAGVAQDIFGASVAISGETVIVGAFHHGVVGTNTNEGSAYVFVRNGTNWTQQQQLTAADGAFLDNFGFSVGISGETAVVSAPSDDVGANVDQGSAYTFVRNGTTWTQQQKLTAADGAANDYFAWSVAISGETVIVGAELADVSAANQGAAYTFARSGTVWTMLQKVVAPDAAANDNFGTSVSISGERAIVGAPFKRVGTHNNQGAAYIFATVLPPPPTPTPSPTPSPTVQPNTPVGAPVTVETLDASSTFPTVTQAGNTTFSEIDPDSAGTPPAGYVICRTCPAYDITTTAVYTPPVSVCLGVPRAISQQAFLGLALLHGEGGSLVDRTTGRFTDDGGNRTVCGGVSSLSPFVLAQGQPTAAPSTISGRIVDSNGLPVEGAVVRLAGTQNRKFITDANGFYRFENVETSGFYTVTPMRVNYSFSPASRSFSQLGESTEATFAATSTGQNANPLDTPEYFVRQNYLDFLGREPDEAGFNFWSDQILECGEDTNCFERRRENVSAAYFLAIEFQQTGGLVDGLYRVSYGARPQFTQFMSDTRTVGQDVVVGRDGWQAKLAANKQAFLEAFVNRPAFHAAYDGLDNSLFVDALISHAGVNFSAAERDAFVSGLVNGTLTRSGVLRDMAENERFVAAKFNEAFVMMEYFGYLRRDPDDSGYSFWLNKLNEFNGNFEHAEMVKAFIVSSEYRDRFPQ